jgi:YYY domain-containing protein
MKRSTTIKNQSRVQRVGIMVALLAILVVGGAFRFYNVNWDKGTYHIHPDERSTTMVITAIRWPSSLAQYFDTSHSPLNPRNADTVYFYGTLPLFLTKFVATQLDEILTTLAKTNLPLAGWAATVPNLTGYDQIHLVGRVLSALFDLGTVLLLFFLARRLFDWRVGLVAALLLALAVLDIQGSHYFTVDTFLAFFVVLTMWFVLDVAEGKGWPSFVALGLSMGLTLSCKVSVFLLVVVVALAAWFWMRRRQQRGLSSSGTLLRAVSGLALASILALSVFRVAQPYAWAGPNYDGWDSVPEPWGTRLRIFEKIPEPIRAVIMPNPQWIADIVSAGAQQTGEADMPWGRQWTERTPWLFPLENMVIWGMGAPLGVAAWLGVILLCVQGIWVWRRFRKREPGHSWLAPGRWPLLILPLAWVVLTFLWQGMQFVKSIRYFLPIYPFLALFAAYLVVMTWDWAKKRSWRAKTAAGALAVVVVVGTLAWAWAFIQIYREPVTRVQATRWMYDNIETGATLHYTTVDGQTGQLQVPLPATQVYAANGEWLATPFTLPQDAMATDVVMNNLTGLEGPSAGAFEAQIVSTQWVGGPLTEAQIEATFGSNGEHSYVLDFPDVALTGGQTYLLQTRALEGAPLISEGSAIANEHFDDPLPFNMDGKIAFGAGPYRGLNLTLYDEDTPEKLQQLLDTLDETDYISMSSGRLWQSIPRLPMRYPVTTRYYQLLFAGKLGFEKVAEFHSYPRLFGIEFNDTLAEEQFTVYDHPKVLIYHKTADYDRAKVEAMLSEGIDWNAIPQWLNPRDVPRWKQMHQSQNDLMLTPAQEQVQTQGGTWALLFDRNSLINQWPTLSWLVLIGILGLAALPLTVAVFRWLPDQGYILARIVGVLLLPWLSWILTNLTPLHYTRATILLAFGLIVLGSFITLLSSEQRHRLLDLWRTRKRLIFGTEALFLAFFVFFWIIRWANPDLWHPWMGGEKPMDFAYLNAVIKSTEFPPYDPWFSGGYLNYYYFGQVMVGTLIKLIGIVPSVAYNLALPLWFAMTAMGAFSVTYNLVARLTQHGSGSEETAEKSVSRPNLGPFFFGLVGALFVVLLGNLGEIHLLLLKLGEGVLSTFQSTIPGLASLVRVIIGSAEVVFGGKALPISINEWYWNASRAIPSAPSESVITEFPFFTFLYSDLHAHLIAMPLTFLSLATALTVVKRAEWLDIGGWKGFLNRLPPLLLWALAIGAMRTTNTWDVPPHLLVVLGALFIAEFSYDRRLSWRLVVSVAWQFALVFVLSWFVLYRPFWASYGAYYNSVAVWTGTRTVLWAYLVVNGLFLFLIVSYLCARVLSGRHSDPLLRRIGLTLRYWTKRRRLCAAARIVGVRHLPSGALAWLMLGFLVLLEMFFLIPGLVPLTRADPGLVESGVYAYRGLVVFALGLPVGLMGLLLLLRPEISPTQRLWAYLVLLGLGMSLGVELIVLQGDIGRMNTVFKFYLQVWLMWGVAAAAALAWMLPRLNRWLQGRRLWLGILTALLAAAALYPPLATSAKVRDRFDDSVGPTLDGWAYMKTAQYSDPVGQQYDLKWDLEAIQWLLDNVVGSPVILEGHAPEYRWGARYSINTGLPTVLGWNWHQRQQRAAANDQEVWQRADDVATIYNTPMPDQAVSLLREYSVRYIVVGPLERAYYEASGLAKFEQMASNGVLHTVFRNEGVTIYEVTW